MSPLPPPPSAAAVTSPALLMTLVQPLQPSLPKAPPVSLPLNSGTQTSVPNFAARFYPLTDTPAWTAEKETLRSLVKTYSTQVQDPSLYMDFIGILISNVALGQSPQQLTDQWKAYFGKRGSSSI